MVGARVLVWMWVWVGLCPMWAWGQTTVPHEFQDGEVIEAREFNDNFEALEAAIDGIPAGPKGDKGDTGATGPSGVSGWQAVTESTIITTARYANPSSGARAFCPAGKVAIGGGWEMVHQGAADNTTWVSSIKPHKNNLFIDSGQYGWEVALVANTDVVINVLVKVTAICINAL